MQTLIQISQPTVWRILKWTIKWKPFKFLTVQGLEQSHIDQRKEFCEWLLQQSQEFPQKVLWEVISPISDLNLRFSVAIYHNCSWAKGSVIPVSWLPLATGAFHAT